MYFFRSFDDTIGFRMCDLLMKIYFRIASLDHVMVLKIKI